MAPEPRRRKGDELDDRVAGRQNIPVPDPSLLTTRALQREIFALRELIEVKLGTAVSAGEQTRTIIETRLDGMDLAIQLLQADRDKFPGRIDEKIVALRQVHDEKFKAIVDWVEEKFASIQKQFDERDVRTEQAAGAVKIAVDAALQAQKEAAGEQNRSNTLAQTKSETATTKQIDQIGTLIQNNTKSFDDKINDVKDRVNRIEGSGEGGKAMWAYVAGAVALAASLYFGLNHLQGTPPAAAAPQVIYVPAPANTLLPTTPPAQVPR